MHDLDRTQQEFAAYESDEYENDEYENDEYENDEYENDEYGYMGEAEYESEAVFSEAAELELAAELLEVSDEQELDQFLGKLLRRARRAVGGVLRSPIGKALGGMLKGVALPMVGGALGSFVAPGIGTALGSKLGTAAGSLLGLELEGLSDEDQEFEVARQLVRLGGEAVRQAALQPAAANPQAVAQQAFREAARQHAPGLVRAPRQQGSTSMPRRRTRGVWTRRGNKIILHGL